MIKMKVFKFFFLFCIYFPILVKGKGLPMVKKEAESPLKFEENKNQYDSRVLYETDLVKGGKLFLEKNTFTYLFYNAEEIASLHHPGLEKINPIVHFHCFKAEFINS